MFEIEFHASVEMEAVLHFATRPGDGSELFGDEQREVERMSGRFLTAICQRSVAFFEVPDTAKMLDFVYWCSY